VGEARSNVEVFAELCRRTGVARAGEPDSAEGIWDAILAAHPQGARVAADLERAGLALPESGPAPVQFVDVFPRTPDGKIHLVPKELDREAPGGLYGYWPDPATERHPLTLISPATDKRISSTLGQLHRALVAVEMNPADAEARGIADGDRVCLSNELGEVIVPARVTRSVRAGVLVLPKGLWAHNTENGATSNVLSPDTFTDLGEGACFNDARVEVERLGSGRPGSA
jgi:anaerobic selenocysteine-containing dehydrogenase